MATALSADKRRTWATIPAPVDIELELGGTVYEGSYCIQDMTGDNHVIADPGSPAADQAFVGQALKGGVSGDKVKIRCGGILETSLNETVTNEHFGADVFVDGDDELDTTTATNKAKVGKVCKVITEGGLGTNKVLVDVRGVGLVGGGGNG